MSWQAHLEIEDEAQRHFIWKCCGRCTADLFLLLWGKHSSERPATTSSFDQFEHQVAEGCIQRVCQFGSIACSCLSDLNSMLAGGLCNRKASRRTAGFENTSICNLGASIAD